MIYLTYGTLPTRSFIHSRCRSAGLQTDATMRTLRSLLGLGQLEGTSFLLRQLGFAWRAGEGPCPRCGDVCLCADVAAVADALAPTGAQS